MVERYNFNGTGHGHLPAAALTIRVQGAKFLTSYVMAFAKICHINPPYHKIPISF